MNFKFFIYSFILFAACADDNIVLYFEYPDHEVLNIGSRLTDMVVTNDSNTLIVADKGNNQVRFIDVSGEEMVIVGNVWVGSEPTSLELTADGLFLLVGLQGASSVSVVSVQDQELLASIALNDNSYSGVYDIEYINTTDQLIVSYVASNPTYNKTKLYNLDLYPADGASTFTAVPSTFEISGLTYPIEDDFAGSICVSDDEQFLYIIDRFGGVDRVYKYQISGIWDGPDSFSSIVGDISIFHDIEYVPGFGIVVAVEGMDPFGEEVLDHSPVFDLNGLNHVANFGVGSTPIALTYDSIGEHLYISPTDVDDNGVFVIEYSIETQLQTNYYQVAGRLGSHALVVDHKGEYLYAAVDDLSDQDTNEPYNNSSFNIQRIEIIPEDTYNAINNFD